MDPLPTFVRKTDRPKRSQAERVIAKFGGARRLARLLGKDPSRVYRWTYPKERGGTGGLIPTASLQLVLATAKLEGVFLDGAEDLDPNPR